MTVTGGAVDLEIIPYTVTYLDFNGDELYTQQVGSGFAAAAPADPARTGYHFTGWYTADGAKWDFGADVVTEDVTLTGAYGAHAEKSTTTPATCTEDGKIVFYCTICGAELRQQILPALGHNYVGKLTAYPTFDAVGSTTFTCTRCGDKYTEAIPKLIKADSAFLKSVAPAVLRSGLNPDTQLYLVGKTLWLVIDGKGIILSTNANNRNVSGSVAIGDGGTLTFDLKGNGSNIKTFAVK